MNLTIKQKELMEIAEKNGFITLSDTHLIYSSELARKSAIKRLCLMGLLRDVGSEKFKLNQRRLKNEKEKGI